LSETLSEAQGETPDDTSDLDAIADMLGIMLLLGIFCVVGIGCYLLPQRRRGELREPLLSGNTSDEFDYEMEAPGSRF